MNGQTTLWQIDVADLEAHKATGQPIRLLTPRDKGNAGADDAAKHMADHAPGWVLEKLGDALLSLRDVEFTTDDLRRIAGPTVDSWLTAEKVRRNVFSGWFQKRVAAFTLVRVGSRASTRTDRRGAYIALWRFPK